MIAARFGLPRFNKRRHTVSARMSAGLQERRIRCNLCRRLTGLGLQTHLLKMGRGVIVIAGSDLPIVC